MVKDTENSADWWEHAVQELVKSKQSVTPRRMAVTVTVEKKE